MQLITLTQDQMKWGQEVGTQRQKLAEKNKRPDAYGLETDNPLKEHIQGARAELAVAVALNVVDNWDPVWDDIDRTRGDVGGLGVRSTPVPNGHLLLHRRDHDDRYYVLVCGKAPSLTIIGSILGQEGKQEKYWQERKAGRPCFWVPQRDLVPFS